MKNLKQINDELWISGQPTEDELRSASDRFRTVVNLRTADESGLVPDEERLVEGGGISYAPIPVSPATLDDATAERFSQALASDGATPALIHCQGGGRAGVLTLMHLAVNNAWSLEPRWKKGNGSASRPRPIHLIVVSSRITSTATVRANACCETKGRTDYGAPFVSS
jgi:uncharacterized protein (TIGR01244 family)